MENTKPNKQGTAHLFYNGAVEIKNNTCTCISLTTRKHAAL